MSQYNLSLARTSDPDTSHDAAARASDLHPDDHAADIVASVMKVGKPMTDPEICKEVNLFGHVISNSRIRHGRKRLDDTGKIRLTGERRDGCREWVWA